MYSFKVGTVGTMWTTFDRGLFLGIIKVQRVNPAHTVFVNMSHVTMLYLGTMAQYGNCQWRSCTYAT